MKRVKMRKIVYRGDGNEFLIPITPIIALIIFYVLIFILTSLGFNNFLLDFILLILLTIFIVYICNQLINMHNFKMDMYSAFISLIIFYKLFSILASLEFKNFLLDFIFLILLTIFIIYMYDQLRCVYCFLMDTDSVINRDIHEKIENNLSKNNLVYISRKNKFLWQRVEKIENNYLIILYDKIHEKDVSSIIIFDRNKNKIFQKKIFDDLYMQKESINIVSIRNSGKITNVKKIDRKFKKLLHEGNKLIFLKLECERNQEKGFLYYKINLKNISNKKLFNITTHFFYLSNWNLFLLNSEYYSEEILSMDIGENINKILMTFSNKKLIMISTFMDEDGNEYIASSKIR